MPTFVGPKEKFASEYPDRPNPIGMRVRVRRDPALDREFRHPEWRRDGLGEVVDYSNGHGLCFEVKHLGPDSAYPRAWYEAEEVCLDEDPHPSSVPTDLGAEISNL